MTIVRALDDDHDWQFGKGRNDYKRDLKAVDQDIQTRLLSFLGDCFFDLGAGIDWFNRLGAKDRTALQLDVSSVILNTPDVTGLLQNSVSVNATTRNITLSYQVQTTLGQISRNFQYDLNGTA